MAGKLYFCFDKSLYNFLTGESQMDTDKYEPALHQAFLSSSHDEKTVEKEQESKTKNLEEQQLKEKGHTDSHVPASSNAESELEPLIQHPSNIINTDGQHQPPDMSQSLDKATVDQQNKNKGDETQQKSWPSSDIKGPQEKQMQESVTHSLIEMTQHQEQQQQQQQQPGSLTPNMNRSTPLKSLLKKPSVDRDLGPDSDTSTGNC